MKTKIVLCILCLFLRVTSSDATPNDSDLASSDTNSHSHHMMGALFGSYPHTREASGTAWEPESTPMQGRH